MQYHTTDTRAEIYTSLPVLLGMMWVNLIHQLLCTIKINRDMNTLGLVIKVLSGLKYKCIIKR